MSEHTPTPWRAKIARWKPDTEAFGFGIYSDYVHPRLPIGIEMHSIAGGGIYEHSSFSACYTPEQIEANADFIVKCVNSHEALVAALRQLHDNNAEYGRINNLGGYDNQDMKQARAALKLAAAL